MTKIASLPALAVEIAFTPTDLWAATQSWTDVTVYVRDFSTHGGRQHYLDRIEASTFNVRFDNRTGYFLNGGVNGTGAIIGPRLPIRVQAEWDGTLYTIFRGVIDTINTSLEDALNADLAVSAADNLRFLSLRNLYNATLYNTYADVTSTRSFYAKVNRQSYVDSVGTFTGSINGFFESVDGVCLYTYDKAAFLTESNTFVFIPCFTAGAVAADCGIDFWIRGDNFSASTLIGLVAYQGFFLQNVSLLVDNDGIVYTANGLRSTSPLDDGLWHHVALYISSTTGLLTLSVDGVLTQSSGGYGGAGFIPLTGNGANYTFFGQGVCTVDKITISNVNITDNEVKNRYLAGQLLTNETNAGDRIAEALIIANRGTISTGVYSVPNYNVNGSAYVHGASSNGTVLCGASTTPVVTASCLDTIQEAGNTEIGVFFQADDGSLNFHTRAYPYRSAGNAAPPSKFVWTDDTTSTYHYEPASFQLTRDDVDTWSSVIISPNGGTPQLYTNTAIETRWGQATLSRSTTASGEEAAYRTAEYLGQVYATPLPRVQTLNLSSLTNNGANLDAMLGANLQDRVTVKRTPINPSAAGITNTDMLVESINHDFTADPGRWVTSVTLDPYPIRFSTQASPIYVMLADDATYGIADRNVAL